MLLSFISSYRSSSVCLTQEHLISVVAHQSIVWFVLSMITSCAFSPQPIITRSFFVFIISNHSASGIPIRVMGTTCLSAIVRLTYIDSEGQTVQIINTHLMFSRKKLQEQRGGLEEISNLTLFKIAQCVIVGTLKECIPIHPRLCFSTRCI